MIPVFGVLALLFTFWKSAWVSKQEEGTEKMSKIAKSISEGAMAFLKAEYKVLAIFVVIVGVLMAMGGMNAASSPLVGLSFVIGAFCSALAGFIGMKVTAGPFVYVQMRQEQAWEKREVAFAGGSVMGMGVVGLGLLGLGLLLPCTIICGPEISIR